MVGAKALTERFRHGERSVSASAFIVSESAILCPQAVANRGSNHVDTRRSLG